mgnify:CR=1 FL=1
MKSRVLLAVLLAATLMPACRRGGGDEILIGEYGSLTGTTATSLCGARTARPDGVVRTVEGLTSAACRGC